MNIDFYNINSVLNGMFLKEGRFFFFLLLTNVGIHSFMWRMEYHKFNKRYFEKLFSSFFFLLGFFLLSLLISFFLPNIFWKTFKWIAIVLCSFFYVFEVIVFYEYQMFLTNRTFSVLMQTNQSEATECLKEILTVHVFLLLLFCGISLYYFPLFFGIGLTFLFKFSVFRFLFYAVCLIAAAFFIQGNIPKKCKRYYSYISLLRILSEFKIAFKKEKQNKEALGEQKKIKITIEKQEDKVDTVILVIGESASRNYMQVYNYYLKTSPFLQKEKESNNVLVFENVISPESLTSLVVPQIMTTKNYEEEKEWYFCQNIISTFKEAGYKTYWISNQPKNEAIGKVFSNLADISFFGEEKRIDDEGYDNILLLEGLPLIGKEKKRLIVFHLIGSHNSYVKRYPKEYAIFTEKNVTENHNSRVKKYIAEYCNSLRYTDYILEQIVKYFQDENMALFYLSDHAEEMYESRNVRGHSGDNGSRYMVEIPMILYSSQKFQEKNKKFWDSCQYTVNRPYSSDDFIHTFLAFSGIYTDFYDETRNILSSQFNDMRKRMYIGRDYDSYWKIL